MHGDPICRYLVDKHGVQPLPENGIEVVIHARYDVRGQSPPDRFHVGDAREFAGDMPTLTFHLLNYSGEGTSGFLYDALTHESPSAISAADAILDCDSA